MEMNSVSGNPSEASMQLGLLDAVKDLLAVNPVFFDWGNCDLRCADSDVQKEQGNAESQNSGGIAGALLLSMRDADEYCRASYTWGV